MGMQRYANRSGNSGVVAYEIGADWIEVKFVDRPPYRYTYARTGESHVEAMKNLAIAGRGLGSYISRHVRMAYEPSDDQG